MCISCGDSAETLVNTSAVMFVYKDENQLELDGLN